jgi:hypothetical protein
MQSTYCRAHPSIIAGEIFMASFSLLRSFKKSIQGNKLNLQKQFGNITEIANDKELNIRRQKPDVELEEMPHGAGFHLDSNKPYN